MFLLQIDPKPDIIQAWLSNNETKRDLITHIFDTKAEFIINLYDYHYPTKKFQKIYYDEEEEEVTSPGTSRYTHIWLPYPSADELKAMTFLSSEKNDQNDEAYPMHANNMEKYLSRTDC